MSRQLITIETVIWITEKKQSLGILNGKILLLQLMNFVILRVMELFYQI